MVKLWKVILEDKGTHQSHVSIKMQNVLFF